jgi:hypothetical protein
MLKVIVSKPHQSASMSMLAIAPKTISNNVFYLLNPKVAALDFERIKYKYTASSESEMTAEQWDHAEQEYRRFLSLKVLYPSVSLVPSKEVDSIWHAHILDTRAYREDCESVFGRFIDHYPYFGIYGAEDYQSLKSAFAETVTLYEHHFGTFPHSVENHAARCGGDHSCHVPSACACRGGPGACK